MVYSYTVIHTIYIIHVIHATLIHLFTVYRFVTWLCLENLPVVDDVDESSSESQTDTGPASKKAKKEKEKKTGVQRLLRSIRDQERVVRSTVIAEGRIDSMGPSPYTECKKLLKDLERCKNATERIQLGYFIYPVNEKELSDYGVYVRNPIDLSTIKYKLDGTLPGIVAIKDSINKKLPKVYSV